MHNKPLYILIAGPYTSGSSDKTVWMENHKELNRVAYEVYLKGHIPVIGVNMALPIIEAVGDEHFEQLMMPLSLAIADKCDAVLRVGGSSKGADEEVAIFVEKKLPVYTSLEDIPSLN